MEEITNEFRKTNKYQTKLTEELRKSLHKEVWGELTEFLDSVKFIDWLIQPEEIRGYASDRPRDDKGRIIVDITKPHILNDMNYFRERALFFEKHGKYTHIRPNPNPKSEYAQFWKKELYKWKYGVVRESDGEWIPGGFYFYLNYSPIWINTEASKGADGKKVRGIRKKHFPNVWLGDYLFFHYLEQAREAGAHAKILKTRGVGASYKLASMSPRNMYIEPGLPNFHLASDKGFLDGEKGVFGKVLDVLDWIKDSTPFSGLRLVNSPRSREIQLGYEEDGSRKGYKSSVYGISLKDNPDKARGVRGPLIHYEEDGLFPNLEKAWSVNRKAVEDGDIVYGLMCALGTGGVEGADFEGSEKLFRNPLAYNIYGIPNVFDKNSNGESLCGFFWGAYLNRARCYDNINGEPDVIKSLIEVLNDRFTVKYNSSDPQVITQKMAEEPIVPSEAMMRTSGTIFPVADLKDYRDSVRIQGQRYFDTHYIGDLVLTAKGVEWKPSNNSNLTPIRRFPTGTDKPEGAVEIFEMPKTDHKGKIDPLRYIAGIDPIDDDHSGTNSLASIRVMDLYTDRVVAEFTGRPKFANDFYEICRRMLIFYNAKANYEAHPYSEIVKLPTGETKLWGDVKIGDKLFSPNGGIVNVVNIPIDEYMPIYKIILNDDREVMCSDNHVWSLYKLNDHPHNIKNYTTSQILEIGAKNKYKQNNFFIPNGGSVNYREQLIPIDAYTMGLIIAEGCLNGSHCTKNQIQISSSIIDMDFYKTIIPYNIKYIGTKGFNWNLVIENCKKTFESLNLLHTRSETKFIPEIYLYNSREIRIELLKGLMDGDGHATKTGSAVYVTSSKRLSVDFMSLCRSLGFNCKSKRTKTSNLDSYKIIIYTDEKIFNLPRKIKNQYVHDSNLRGSKANSYINKTAIKSIEFSHYEMGKCITVDSSDGLYLIGDYVVTHNCDKKGLFSYFDQKRGLNLLCETPQILKDMEYAKGGSYGNKALGTNSGKMINAWGRRLQKDWLLSPASIQDFDPEGTQIGEKLNMHTERGIAYIEELISWNADINADRISAMGMLMIYREDRLKYLANKTSDKDEEDFDKYIEENFKNAYSNNQNSYVKWQDDVTFS